MDIYVISLNRARERRQFMQKQMESLGLSYEIVDAVDYQQLTGEEFKELTDEAAVRNNPYLTKGMQACALSHAKVLNKIAAAGDKTALVLEDDAVLPDNIKELLRQIEAEIKQNEVIALSYYYYNNEEICLSNQRKTNLSSDAGLFYPVDLHYFASTMAYVVTAGVAGKMARAIMPVSVLPDSWASYYERGAFESFRCVYPVTVMPALFRSTLGYAAEKAFKSRVAAFIRRNNLPVISTWLEKRSQRIINNKYLFRFLDLPPFMETTFHPGKSKNETV